ncbi:MAG: hypothetical protein ACRBN8_21080 [Nannocystales bacterium]
MSRSPSNAAPAARRWGIRVAVALGTGLAGVLHGACEAWEPVDNGWVVACEPGASANEDEPEQVCINRNIDGGVTKAAMSAACSQSENQHTGEMDANPSDFPLAAIHEEDGSKVGCTLEEHPFPVYAISSDAGTGDEAGSENPNANAAACVAQFEVALGLDEDQDEQEDEQDKYESEFALDPFEACIEGDWEPLAAAEFCAARCEEWLATSLETLNPEGAELLYELIVRDGNGDCDPGNFEPQPVYLTACEAQGMGGAVWEADAQLSFSDPLNPLSALADGVLSYDNSMCTGSGPCEPEVLMTFSLPSLSFPFTDDTGATHDVVVTDAHLSTLQPTAVTVDPSSGLQQIEALELEFAAAEATVDGVSVGPLLFRDIVSVDVTTDRSRGRIQLGGSSELAVGPLHFEFHADLTRSATWPG